mmetsp:Transcript_21691/g.53102  ORF Transcript_21691/g.53102 Transcript_21691/m.53102 type:complete len:92 (+) Transcript_21691:661-936(+)
MARCKRALESTNLIPGQLTKEMDRDILGHEGVQQRAIGTRLSDIQGISTSSMVANISYESKQKGRVAITMTPHLNSRTVFYDSKCVDVSVQ